MINVMERFDGLMSTFVIKGVIAGKNAGQMQPERGARGPGKKFCRLAFIMPGAGTLPKNVEVSLPDTMDADQFAEGEYVELPVTISFFEGRMTIRAVDTNANAKMVGQAARTPGRANAVIRPTDPADPKRAA
jgi:hypothetical protein